MGRREREVMPTTDAVEFDAVVQLLSAIIAEGWRKADLVAASLPKVADGPAGTPSDALGLASLTEISSIPNANFWIELGSLLRLRQWEASGLRSALPADLPSCDEAAETLRQASASDGDDDACHLTDQQLDAWLSHFAWEAPQILGVDSVIQGAPSPDDEILDALAKLLWESRNFSDERATVVGDDRETT